MFKFKLNYRVYFHIFIVLILIGATVISFPAINVFSSGEPTITIVSPSSGEEVNSKDVVISGTYTADVPKSDLLFTATDNGQEITDLDLNIDETITSKKTWSFSALSLEDGSHNVSIEIKKISTSESSSESLTFTVNTLSPDVKPTISIQSPSQNSVINSKHVVIKGEYTADVPKTSLLFTVYDNGNSISDSSAKEPDWLIDETAKTWTFSTSLLEEGDHNFLIEIKKKTTNNVATESTTLKISLTRPYITETGIILPDNVVRNGEDLTNVPLNSKITMTVADDQKMDQMKSNIETNKYNPIKILLGSDTKQGTTEINELDVQNGIHYYEIIFTPNSNELQLNTTYLVYLDPKLVVDDLDNPVFTKLFKFTTMSNAVWDDPDDPQSHASSNPHGHYQLNTNMCASCHSTHASNSPSLTGGTYQTTFKEELADGERADDPSQNYCMACHDGTMNAAPIIDKNNSKYRHNNPSDYSLDGTNALKRPNSCTSCHNPHLEWTEDNPNLLKDHYVYTHNEAHPEDGLETPTVDSLDNSCDSCHNYIDFSQISADKGKQETLAYKKSLTAKGTISNKLTDSTLKTISDYSLCLRCHNPEKSVKDSKPTDIETDYLNQNSGHNFVLPADKQTQRDGSMLSGPIPCAECHETHGSNNLFNLREILGNNPTLPTADQFKTVGTVWNEENERNFCLNCHNKGTEIYGKKAAIDKAISGHQDSDSRACSECHSDQTKSYSTFREKSRSAAHAPLPGVDPSN